MSLLALLLSVRHPLHLARAWCRKLEPLCACPWPLLHSRRSVSGTRTRLNEHSVATVISYGSIDRRKVGCDKQQSLDQSREVKAAAHLLLLLAAW